MFDDDEYNRPQKVLHNDDYRISIWELFFKYKPGTIDSMKKILEENGYYGRCKVMRIEDDKGKLTNKAKAEIYLPNSAFTYQWPLNNHYNLTTRQLDKKFKFSKPCLAYTLIGQMMHGLLWENVLAYDDLGYKIQAIARCGDTSPYRKAIMILIKAGLTTTDFKLRLKECDIDEIYDNWFEERKIEFLTP